VETTRGFVLHSTDMVIDNATLPIGENIGLTITLDMLRAIARGQGPSRAVLALGYASWGAGQLESEIKSNTWLHGPVETDLLFGLDHAGKYDRALRTLGVSPAFLSSDAGNA
jgi:putative transcriptional regulator